MINVYMRGRLGNQLFQYAFVRSLQQKYPDTEVNYLFNDVYKSGKICEGWENSLQYFNVKDVKEINTNVKLSFIQKIIMRFYWFKYPHEADIKHKNIYQMKWIKLLNLFGLFYLDLGYFNFNHLFKGEIIISGNFESEKYFNDVKDEIKKEITPIYPILEHNQELYKIIQNSNSICISVRRGDFVNNPDFSKLLNVCDKDYFVNAIELMSKKVINPVFIFFSDDIEWVKTNIKIGYTCYYETGNDPVWEKLRLMYSCKHFIISNSTFSWWAQYLGRYPKKIVIAPKRWYNSELKSELLTDEMIKL